MSTASDRALHRVVVAIDHEQETQDALALARVLCEETGAELIATSALDAAAARSYMDLRRKAEADGADVIVIGARPNGPDGHPPTETISETALNGATCAVAIAPLGFAQEVDGYRVGRIAVAYDGSRDSAAALALAAALAERTGAELALVGAVETGISANGFDPALVANMEERRLRRHMERARNELDPRQGLDERVVRGPAAQALAEAAVDADLMVMGSRARFAADKAVFIGVLGLALIRRATCPLMVAPAA